MRTHNRWTIAVAGIFMQVALGAVYAWSVFRVPLAKQFWLEHLGSHVDVYDQYFRAGHRCILRWPPLNKGPRVVAWSEVFFMAWGIFASFSANNSGGYQLWAGRRIGLGFGYIVPVAVLSMVSGS
jgi:OFA family oxalate/formate antiporter-like MFS transporter